MNSSDDDFREIDPEPVPEVTFDGRLVKVVELLEHKLAYEVRFAAPLVQVDKEILYTGSILKSNDGRLYFLPSGTFDDLKSLSEAAE